MTNDSKPDAQTQLQDNKAHVKKLFKSLDFLTPIDYAVPAERAKYIPGLHGGTDAVANLQENIELLEGQGVFLFTGQSGTGKSSELKRLKNELQNNANYKVFYLDLEDWLNLSEAIDIHTFLLAVVSAWTLEVGGAQATDRSYINRLFDLFVNTEVSVSGASATADIGAIKSTLSTTFKNKETLSRAMEAAGRSYKESMIQQIHSYVADLAHRLSGQDGKCVLLIDSLEKIRSTAANAELVYTSIQNLFTLNVNALKLPLTHVVYSISPVVLEQNKQLPVNLGGALAVYLPSVHIYKNREGDSDEDCINKIFQLLTARHAQWRNSFDEIQVKEVIKATGGDLRDFLRVLQAALSSRQDKTGVRVDSAALSSALEQVRPTLDITEEDMAWLYKLHQTKTSALGGAYGFMQLAKYLGTKHVLYYRNGETWYDSNPQIVEAIEKRSDAYRTAQKMQ
jgi:KAP family P-loop domain